MASSTTAAAAAAALKISSDKIVLGKGFIQATNEFKEKTPGKSALVLGGTGEVGREVIKHLLASGAFDKVTAFTRRPIEYTGVNSEKLVQKPIDFENEEQLKKDFSGHSHAYSCLGTTRAKSGKEGFYKIDHDYVLNAAKACKAANIESYSICSSTGANKNSNLLYSRTKGEVDDEVLKMGFANVGVFRPAMIECEREESRIMEKMASYVLPVLKLAFPKTVGIPSSTIAWSMVYNSIHPTKDRESNIFSNAEMLDMFEKNQ
ncbi:Oxidoreductase htatip2 [Coemansia sp. RSA 2703]|nr:Oxidoreductase htatip2 [Coemansia sp. RSA 2703]KAJ2367629.1 Oxidoreductase htatip2 [Coemansia sp. RSA 2607]KAJ2395739.1 Oxidoreductase htatip2 [Coemansia sp. RSA 2603]